MKQVLVAALIAATLAMTAGSAEAFWVSCDVVFGWSWC